MGWIAQNKTQRPPRRFCVVIQKLTLQLRKFWRQFVHFLEDTPEMDETESHQKKDIEDMTSLLMEDEGSTFDEWVFKFRWMISKKWIPHITESTKTQKILEPFFWPPLYFSVGQFPDTLLLFSRVILYKPFSLVRNMGNAMTSSGKVCMVCLTITPR